MVRPSLMELGKGWEALAPCWRLLLCRGSTEDGACLQMVPVLEVERSIFPLLVKMKRWKWRRLREAFLSFLPGHHFFSRKKVLPVVWLIPSVLNAYGSLSPTLVLDCSGKMWMLCIWKCSGTESHCWKTCCGMKNAKGGWEDPTVLFSPQWNWNGCLCRHNLQEQKLWVRNVETGLMEGDTAFCAVSLNSGHLIFCLCSTQKKGKKKIRRSDLQLLVVCLLLMSCTFWRGNILAHFLCTNVQPFSLLQASALLMWE